MLSYQDKASLQIGGLRLNFKSQGNRLLDFCRVEKQKKIVETNTGCEIRLYTGRDETEEEENHNIMMEENM